MHSAVYLQRLLPQSYTEGDDRLRALFQNRLIKEVAHELGHTFGLRQGVDRSQKRYVYPSRLHICTLFFSVTRMVIVSIVYYYMINHFKE
jgi:preprotein translocase subunit SecE